MSWNLKHVSLAYFKFEPFSAIATSEVADVREVLNYYRQFDDPLGKFRENQRILSEQMAELEQQEQVKPKPAVRKWTPSFMGGRS